MRGAQHAEQSAHHADQHTQRAGRAAAVFNRACQLTGLSSAELCRRLPAMIGRPKVMSRQTLAAWRRGRQAVPLVAFLAACDLAGMQPPVIFTLADDGGEHE